MKQRPVPVSMGSARFRTLECTGCTVTEAWFPPRATLPPHTHDRPIFAVALAGAIESSIAGRRLACTHADVWTEPLAERHSNAIGRDGARVLVIQPDPMRTELFEAFDRLLSDVSFRRHAGVAADAGRVAAELRIADGLSRVAIDGLVLAMLAAGARSADPGRRRSLPPPWLERAREMIHDRFREHLEITDVAAAAGVPPARLAQSFRRHYGSSPGEYLRTLRVRWAADRLTGTDTSISRIAVTAGFSDQSHLTREFRRRLGCTPGAYRRSAR